MLFSVLRSIFILFLTLLTAWSGGAPSDGRVIPVGEFEARELTMEMRPETISIMARFRASVEVNAEWFRDYIHQFPDADTSPPRDFEADQIEAPLGTLTESRPHVIDKGHLHAMLRVIDEGEVLVNETITLRWDL